MTTINDKSNNKQRLNSHPQINTGNLVDAMLLTVTGARISCGNHRNNSRGPHLLFNHRLMTTLADVTSTQLADDEKKLIASSISIVPLNGLCCNHERHEVAGHDFIPRHHISTSIQRTQHQSYTHKQSTLC